MLKRSRLLFAVAALATASTVMAQAPATTRIPGEVIAATADSLTIKHSSGETVAVALTPDVQVQAIKKLSLSDLKSGQYVGVGAKIGADGKQTAVQVYVFPEAARGTGEGHRGWNMGPESTMTNANVEAVVDAKSGSDVKLSYKGGQQTITVPPTALIFTYVPAARSDVAVGKKVVVTATSSGDRYTATRIAVEKDGTVPPT
jgi:predicted transcriptional regulator